ncbi:MAG: sirohydrochlorin cobaltochelatase [Eubacterium sp.]|nr:sirohydrochlorin cobaltochelatase [Eubacterium sp.]
MFKGTKAEAAAAADDLDKWAKGEENAAGKLEFQIPLEKGEIYVPIVALSQKYYEGYKKGENKIEKALYDKLYVINKEAKSLVTNDYELSIATKKEDFYGLSEDEAYGLAKVSATPDLCADLIDAIYVQYRTENTDALCAAARGAWDGLSDAEKEEVEGEDADPDYLGRNTGDASKDDPRNQDGIGKKELLVVSFGTSFNDSRVKDIKGVEDALAKEYPDWSVRRAFTAQIIINHIQARDGYKIDNMDQAMERAVANKVKTMIIQPTHLMHGAEYDELMGVANKYAADIDIMVAEPLLGPVGETETEINSDKTEAATAMVDEAVKVAGFESIDKMAEAGTALVFMGHGTSHEAKKTYPQMQEQMKELGYKNVFVGTVEGKPESTSLPEVKKAVEAAGYKKIILRPMMVVAGDHANNDMADPEDEGSWFHGFAYGGEFEVEGADQPVDIGEGFGVDNVTCQIEGLGRIAGIQSMYVAHTKEAIDYFKEIEEIDNVTSTKVKSFKAKAGKKKVTFTWKKNSTFEGYQLKYKVGKKTKTITVKGSKKVIKKLKKGQKVSGQIRGYKMIAGEKYYGPWAKSKTVKVK